jgi:alpha-beta hydrolase superfamily lysophospholipase
VAKLFGVPQALSLLGRPKKLNRDLPILILIGEEDPLGGPRSVELLARAYRRHGVSDVEVKIYEGGRHEMFNEINRDEVIADLVQWLDAHV